MENIVYIAPFLLIIMGFYLLLLEKSLIKKVIGLNLFQVGIIVFYILIAKIKGGLPPIDNGLNNELYSNPLPHVLMLTAIVVGIATTSLACALIYKIYQNFGTIDELELIKITQKGN